MILKRTDCRQVQWFYCCCSLGSATAGEAGAGLAASEALAALWWLEERCLVDHSVKMVKCLRCIILLVAHD